MSRIFIVSLILFMSSFIDIYCNRINKDKSRSLFPNPLFNSSTKNAKSLKFHSKILQTVYSDSFSKNYYYTTLYVGHNKVRQTYIIDTGSSIMSSPCSPCNECGAHKSPLYYDINRAHKPYKCSSKICKLTPATDCTTKKLKLISSGKCTFRIKREGGDGIKGYFMKDIVYFETDRYLHKRPYSKKLYRSYALPIGCTTGESGKYKELRTDGIMGINNSPKSFINLLYNLKVINRNLFSLCFGLRGGYMSLGEIDTTFHKSDEIQYVPLLTSRVYYLVKLTSVTVGNLTKTNALKTPWIAKIDTGNTISYFPSIIFKSIIKQFKKYCSSIGGKCGNFTYDHNLGYCASFPDRESLFNVIYHYWPNITLNFGDAEYVWRPINYYYYYFVTRERKACLGFNYHSSEKIVLGANFIHGHDVIFDISHKRLGFVPADCSRGNLIWNRWNLRPGSTHNVTNETKTPAQIDKEIHHGENETEFKLGDNNKAENIEFIMGHNTELDRKEFSSINYIILISFIVIISIIIVIVLFTLLCGKKKLVYENKENEYVSDDNPSSNKIAFEESKEE